MKQTVIFILTAILLSSCQTTGPLEVGRAKRLVKGRDYDVQLEVVPTRIAPVDEFKDFDAVFDNPNEADWPQTVIEFRVEKIVEGKFVEKKPRETRWQQMKHAAKQLRIFKFLIIPFEGEKRDFISVDKQSVRIAVRDPTDAFGLTSWTAPAQNHYLVYLKRIPERPFKYFLVARKQLDNSLQTPHP